MPTGIDGFVIYRFRQPTPWWDHHGRYRRKQSADLLRSSAA